MEDLERLILCIQEEYTKINKQWKETDKYIPLNMKYKNIDNIYNDEHILAYIFNYRNFVNDNVVNLALELQNLTLDGVVSSRVKALNSIQYKIENYEKNHENGKIPINKCLNDIFGARIILNQSITFKKICNYINEKFPNLKCIDSSKDNGNYYAIHIYFERGDNYKFQWELQIWDKEHEEGNFTSHFKYKQDYTKWEKENKGGV